MRPIIDSLEGVLSSFFIEAIELPLDRSIKVGVFSSTFDKDDELYPPLNPTKFGTFIENCLRHGNSSSMLDAWTVKLDLC